MRIAVLQPSYLPWLGFFDQMASVDAFVFYDDVQYDRNGWRNRNRIRTNTTEGWSWLTVPVLVQGMPSIIDVHTDPRAPWRRKHLATLRSAYARARHIDLLDRFGDLYESSETSLAAIAIDSIRITAELLSIATPVYRSSDLGIGGDRNGRLLNICHHFNADEYLSGSAARAYLDEDLFAQRGIRVRWQDYEHPTYKQTAEPFISHLSAIDALLNVGTDAQYLVGMEKTRS